MTNGGLGVAFFSPFDPIRYFFPLRPIPVSPIGVARFLTTRGLSILLSEVLLVWLPAVVIGITLHGLRRHFTKSEQRHNL